MNNHSPIPTLIREQRCEKCKYSLMVGQNLECRRNPPVVQILIMNGQPSPVSAFPNIQATQYCGEWKRKIEGVN